METIQFANPTYPVKTLEELAGHARTAAGSIRILDNRLLTLRLNLGRLRAALENAFAPLTATVTPVINGAVRKLTDFCDKAGAVMAALFGTVYQKSVTTVKKTGSAIRRSLASFDQLNRLQGSGSGGGSETVTRLEPVNDALTPELERVVLKIRSLMDTLRQLVAPLATLDFTAAMEAFARLGESVRAFGLTLTEGLSWAWFHLLTPLAGWVVEEAGPASVELLRSAVELLTAAVKPLAAGIEALKPVFEPAMAFLRDTALRVLDSLRSRFESLAQSISQRSDQIAAVFQNLGVCFAALWEKASPHLENLRAFFFQVFDGISTTAEIFVGHMLDALEGLTAFLAGAFTGDWGKAWEGLKALFKGAVNGIIGLINSLLSGIAAGLNQVTATLNKWHVEIPQWVPQVGGKTFGFDIRPISAPQIPYLAQGAVLPANKPFLAVVGDQRHGTNIEAPLATIQEAVALTLEDFAGGNLAGHSATVAVLEQLLAAVQNIRLGDDDIAAACRRSQTRRAVMKGGGYAF